MPGMLSMLPTWARKCWGIAESPKLFSRKHLMHMHKRQVKPSKAGDLAHQACLFPHQLLHPGALMASHRNRFGFTRSTCFQEHHLNCLRAAVLLGSRQRTRQTLPGLESCLPQSDLHKGQASAHAALPVHGQCTLTHSCKPSWFTCKPCLTSP